MNRVSLLSSTMAIPLGVSRRFVPLRQEISDEGGGGGTSDSGSSSDNTGGNSGDSENDGDNQNNSGQQDELTGFWDKPEGSEESDDSDEESAKASQALGSELKAAIDGFKTPELITKEIGEAIANGDFEGVNKVFAESQRQAIQQGVMLSAKLIGAVVTRLQGDVDRRINAALGDQESNQFLEQNFPLAKNPQFRPVVERVWKQALSNSKGDKQKAIRLTRGMLEAMGSEVVPNLREAPDDPTAGLSSAASKSLVDDLLQRGG